VKAAVTTGEKRKMIVKEVPKPQVGEGLVLLKSRAVSICGSDLEYIDGSYEFAAWGKLLPDVTLGHEFCGEVVEIGPGVDGYSIGERVTIGVGAAPCGRCYFCSHGMHRFCVGGDPRQLVYDLMGNFGAFNGALAEYFLIPVGFVSLQKVPDHVTDEEAALAEPFSTGIGGVEAAGVRPGDSVVVIGAGKIGLSSMLAAKAAGASTVIVIDVVPSRLKKAEELGATAVINSKETDMVSEVVRLTEAGPDAVIVCVRDGKVLNESIEMVRRGGIIVLVGFVPPTELNPGVWVVKELRFVGTQGGSITTSMNLIKNKVVDLKPLITEVFPLSDIQQALDSMYSGRNITALIKP